MLIHKDPEPIEGFPGNPSSKRKEPNIADALVNI